MSDPIRRVGGSAGLPGHAEVADGAGGEAFRAALDASQPASAARGATDPAALDAAGLDAAGLAAALRSGELDPRAVLETLVERALAAPAARALSSAARADLERSLRGALAEDPTLLAMQADLGRR